ncbi:MAG: hypothetical protein QM504_15715, partial [Pseudomonadota bacterium]
NKTIPLLIYFIGNGDNERFILNAAKTENLSASTLAGWVNDLQSSTQTRVTFIYDAPESGSFITAMASPNNTYERVNIFSTQAGQGAYYGAQGQLSFSYFFWTNTARGLDVRAAFLNTRKTLSTATRSSQNSSYQQVLMDDNGDGLWDSHSDGNLARVTYLGLNAATASTFPVVFEHQGNQTINPQTQTTVALSAKVDLPPNLLQKVWVLVNAPGQNVDNSTSITQLPEVQLTYNAQNRSYEGSTNLLNQQGDYNLSYYAQSTQGNISEPISANIKVTQNGQVSQCGFIDSQINLTLPCVVVGNTIYYATLDRITHPTKANGYMWKLNTAIPNQDSSTAQCTTVDTQTNLQINCVRVNNTDYKALLNFYSTEQMPKQYLWEFGRFVD